MMFSRKLVIIAVIILSFVVISHNSVMASCIGNNYEQQPPLPDVQLPVVNIVGSDIVVNEGETILLKASATVDTQNGGVPSFFWCAEKGVLEYDSTHSDYSVVKFTAPLISEGIEVIRIFVQVGDGLGYADTLSFSIQVSDDSDEDGMSDAWEMEHFGELFGDGTGDYDNDGLSDFDEYKFKTDPTKADTDGDGISDADEKKAGTDPNDLASKPADPTFNAGIFTVDDTGIVKIDWLYDGGKYQGEFGIFSIAGMENLTPGSPEFIAEAVKRVLSNSEQGYIVFSDLSEGARFSGILGSEIRDWNAGAYKGLKSFAMPAGTQFATILVPNSTFASLSQNPKTEDTNKRPLFSLVSDNPGYGTHIGQMADINGMGKAFAYEDKDAAASDWDYNDLIVQITGAESNLPTLDSLVGKDVSRSKREKRDNAFTDWRTDSELGKLIMSHIESPAVTEDTLRMTVTLNASATLLVYDPSGKFIGREGGTIAGADFSLNADGSQTVTLNSLNPGSYRIAVQSASDVQGTLTVKTYQGSAEISSGDVAVSLAAHQTMTLTVPAASVSASQPLTLGTPVSAASYDFSGDGVVDNADVAMAVKHWNSCRNQQKYDPFYDLDEDGCITVADVMKVLNAKTVK